MTQYIDQYIVEYVAKTNKAAADTKKLAAANDQLVTTYAKAGKNNKRFNAQLQNSSYQIADFAVQVGGGTSALRAFSQQAPQLLAGFGAIGAAVGAVTAILAAGANSLFTFGSAAEKASKSSEQFSKNIEGLVSDSSGIPRLTKLLQEASGEFAGLAGILFSTEQSRATNRIKEIEKDIKSLIATFSNVSGIRQAFEFSTLVSGGFGFDEAKNATVIKGIERTLGVSREAAKAISDLSAEFTAGQISVTEFAEAAQSLGIASDSSEWQKLLDLFVALVEQKKRLKDLDVEIVPDLTGVDDLLQSISGELTQGTREWEGWGSAALDAANPDPFVALMSELSNILDTANATADAMSSLGNLKDIGVDFGDKPKKQGEEIKTLLEELQTEAGKWSDQFADTLVSGLADGKLAFEDFASYVIQQLARIAVSKALEPLFNSFGSFIGGITGAAAPAGLVAVPVNDLPISREMGGTQQMLVGTPRMSAPTSSGSPVTVNVYNQGSDNVEVNERKTTRGVEIDVLIKSTVKRGIASGDFDKVMATSYGARRMAF